MGGAGRGPSTGSPLPEGDRGPKWQCPFSSGCSERWPGARVPRSCGSVLQGLSCSFSGRVPALVLGSLSPGQGAERLPDASHGRQPPSPRRGLHLPPPPLAARPQLATQLGLGAYMTPHVSELPSPPPWRAQSGPDSQGRPRGGPPPPTHRLFSRPRPRNLTRFQHLGALISEPSQGRIRGRSSERVWTEGPRRRAETVA